MNNNSMLLSITYHCSALTRHRKGGYAGSNRLHYLRFSLSSKPKLLYFCKH
jgi:hypothetical protein